MRKGILTMAWCFGLLAVVFASKPAYGAVEGMTLEEMVKEADIIVIGKTVDVTSRWESGGRFYMYTYVTFEVERYIKGEPVSDVIVIKHAGGEVELPIPDEPGVVELPFGSTILTIEVTEEDIEYYKEQKEKFGDAYPAFVVSYWCEDTPTFVIGYRELLLLKRDGSTFEGKPVFYVVGAFQGKYTIVDGKAIQSDGYGLTMEIFISSKRAEMGDESSRFELNYPFLQEIPSFVFPLDELLDRIEEIIATGVIQTSWGKVKSFVSR